MATENKRIQVRRGTAAALTAITPIAGEPVWESDKKTLSMGDGSTVGAILVSIFGRRVAKAGAYTVLAADKNKFFDCSAGTWTFGFTAAATLGDGWACAIFNSGANPITLDPNGAEAIRDSYGSATTKSLAQGEGGIIVCTGTAFIFMRVTAGGGMDNPMSQAGAMITGGTGGVPEELPPGADLTILMMMGGMPVWVDSSVFGALPPVDSTNFAGQTLVLDTNLDPYWGESAGGGGGTTLSEQRYYAVLVTLLRPSKIKWKLGAFSPFTPSERIYVKVMGLCRLGADTSNYVSSNIIRHNGPHEFTVINAGETVTAHNSSAVLAYVTETDVAAVANPKATFHKLMAYLTRDAVITHYQAREATPKTVGTLTTITPNANGSILLELEGQGNEVDLVGTVSGTDRIVNALAWAGISIAGGNADEWVHQAWGKTTCMMPIKGTMDGNTFTWGVRAVSANVTYDGVVNARVAALPANWDTDSVEVGSGGVGMANPMIAEGDIIQADSDGDPVRLPIGTPGQVPTVNAGGTALEYQDPAGGSVPVDTGAAAGDVYQLDTNLDPFWGPAPGGSGGGTKTLMQWSAKEGDPDGAGFPSLAIRNNRSVLEFLTNSSDRRVFFQGIIPEGADLSNGIRVNLKLMEVPTTGTYKINSKFELCTHDLDGDSFGTEKVSGTLTANATSGTPRLVTLDHSSSEIDGLAAGDLFRLAITVKNAEVSAPSTFVAQLMHVEIQSR